MSLGLLGDYASGSSSSSSSEEEEEEAFKSTVILPTQTLPSPALANPFKSGGNLTALPKPSFMTDQVDHTSGPKTIGGSSSVFANPFQEKEERKRAVLEKHVTMTVRQEEQRTIGGKKVCWNYRKGRCRFGHNCTFAHDSDVSLRQKGSTEDMSKLPNYASAPSASEPGVETKLVPSGNEPEEEGVVRKKRPGLGDSLVPGKKAMKFHNKVYNSQ